MPEFNVNMMLGCLCQPSECRESACLKWTSGSPDFVHVRVDDCFITSQDQKKCDCLLFYTPPPEDYTFVFLIEVKSESYDLKEVIEQLQKGRDAFNAAIQGLSQPPTSKALLPLVPGSHTKRKECARLMSRSLANVKRRKFSLVPVLYANKKIEMLRRVGYPFRIKNGSRDEPIVFKKCRENILAGLL